MNLFSILEEAAHKWPSDTAAAEGSGRLRYRDLYLAADALALELRVAGIQRGDKIGILCPNHPEALVALFAVLRVGGIVVSIFPALRAGEIAKLADELGLDAFCYSDQFKSKFGVRNSNYRTETSVLKGGPSMWVERLAERTASQSKRDQLLKINTAMIRFTSGSTARAKGVMVSHGAMLACATAYADTYAIGKADAVLHTVSLAHAPGMALASLLRGSTLVLTNAMKTESLAELVHQHAVTRIYGIPVFYRMMLNDSALSADDFCHVKYFISTGSSLHSSLLDGFRAKFRREILPLYGLAECGGPIMTDLSDQPRASGFVGKPTKGYEVRLMSGDAEVLGQDVVGEIYVRGPSLFDGYYRPWRLRQVMLQDGWFRTGDVARRDQDGFYWIIGRTKAVINVGGVKVFPHELEEILLSYPAVEEVVAYGAPEPRFGEMPHAIVKLRPGAACSEQELLRYANERLSVFKMLRALRFVEHIPKTLTGKTKRFGFKKQRKVLRHG